MQTPREMFLLSHKLHHTPHNPTPPYRNNI